MKIAVVIPHGHTPKWLQTIVFSLKNKVNNEPFDIFVNCTWPGHPSVKAITETSLGDGVTILESKRRKQSHATALEETLEHIQDKGYTHMFCCETDCRAMKDGWLDWFASHVQNDRVGMAGFFWHEGDHHYNINPSATIYNIEMLKQYNAEVRANNSDMFWHPKQNKKDTEEGMDASIKDVAGVFSETRGIHNPTDAQLDKISKGVPNPAWWEPGQWVYARMQGEWEESRVAVDHDYEMVAGHKTPQGTFYGGREDPWFTHFWGGTRCYDFLKHTVDCNFVKSCAPHWIKREDTIWKGTVSPDFHDKVHEVTVEMNMQAMMEKNLGFFIPEAM